MVSSCPACLTQVSHEDHLFEVQCECGTRFNPFMSGNGDLPPLDGSPVALNEDPGGISAGAFQESNAAFQELREFGEALIPAGGDSPPPPVSFATDGANPNPMAGAPPQTVNFGSGDCLMSSGDSFQGYQVTSYFPPMSVVSELNLGGGDPLRNAFDALWNQAKAAGANGVVALKWAMTPDGSKVILSGTPVQCTRLS